MSETKYINVDDAVKYLAWLKQEDGRSDPVFSAKWIISFLEDFPAANVELVRHGRWEYDSDHIPHCSECGTIALQSHKLYLEEKICDVPFVLSKQCHECGAKMDKEKYEVNTMPDREKVIRGLECCAAMSGDYCRKCPYGDECLNTNSPYGMSHLACDALAILKEQEQRVITFEEMESGTVSKWVYCGGGKYCCKRCSHFVNTRDSYCRNCGAKMQEEKEP